MGLSETIMLKLVTVEATWVVLEEFSGMFGKVNNELVTLIDERIVTL